jgi:hypothetical protein
MDEIWDEIWTIHGINHILSGMHIQVMKATPKKNWSKWPSISTQNMPQYTLVILIPFKRDNNMYPLVN